MMWGSIIGRSCVIYLLFCITAYYTMSIIKSTDEDYDGLVK